MKHTVEEKTKAQNFLTHDWRFDGDVLECAKCCVRSYDEVYAHLPCGNNFLQKQI
jgi:hypothetical protein